MNNSNLMRSQKIAIHSHNMDFFKLNVMSNYHDYQKQTILLLHGYLGSSSDYNPFFAKFANTFNLIAIDLRGHGHSDSPEGSWTIDDLVYDVYQIVRLLVPENQKILMVGNSLSTAITLKFVSEYPDLVENIFLISPTSKFTFPLLKRLSINFVSIIPNKIIKASLRTMEKSISKLFKSGSKKEFAKLGIQKIIHVPVSVHKKILRSTLPSYQIDATELQIPMLIIAGEHDTTVPFADSVVLNSSASNSSILMLKNTKHMILVKRTDLVVDIFEQWIQTQTELLTDVKHYHETDLIIDDDGHQMLPEDWVASDCKLKH